MNYIKNAQKYNYLKKKIVKYSLHLYNRLLYKINYDIAQAKKYWIF